MQENPHKTTERRGGPEAGAGVGVWRLRMVFRGAVQGVGFRPFIYRLAKETGLAGWVRNEVVGVVLEVEGAVGGVECFRRRVYGELPVGVHLEGSESVWLDAVGLEGFRIEASREEEGRGGWVRPDVATCPECLAELRDPANRRFRYPFTNCTHCGPRYSIVERLPYDRGNTSMASFRMCEACAREYGDPADRRFHAQPNACPECGPRLAYWDICGARVAEGEGALGRAVEALRSGSIVAVKGLGGFQLMVRADDAEAVRRLRDRKRREEKPFALMFPDIEGVGEVCECSSLEREVLVSPEAPIVLLRRRAGLLAGVAANVAPGQGNLGVMLSYTPLHHVLLGDLGMAVVATSGNLSDEPICIDEGEALVRLRGIADGFLVHDRPIVRQVDDSIVRVVAGREMVMRRARGFAPLPVRVGRGEGDAGEAILGVGGHLKNSVVLLEGERAFVSQHIGDLETVEAHDAFRRVVEDLQELYSVRAGVIAADLHPDYLSSRFAAETGVGVEHVQHHVAHIGAVLAENEVEGRVLGVSWDGTGLGWDRAIWGGEFLVGEGCEWMRLGHLLPFRLPGGDLAAREPRRSALGLAAVMRGDAGERAIELMRGSFAHGEVELLLRVMEGGVHAPWTTSMGRLFDGVAALLGLRGRSAFEGQSAMELEALAERAEGGGVVYEFVMERGSGAEGFVVDWRPVIAGVLGDLDRGIAPEWIAAGFHAALVELVVGMADRAGEASVALGGGCFQNRILLEGCVRRLGEEGYRVYWPQRVPPNDGGLALGQVWVASRRRAAEFMLSRKATGV